MKSITIGRYKAADPITTSPFYDHEFAGTQIDDGNPYSGWIEGVTDDDKSWILYIDKQGRPEIFWPERDEDGGVIGRGIGLQDGRIMKFLEIMSDEDKVAAATRLKGAAEAALRMLEGASETDARPDETS